MVSCQTSSVLQSSGFYGPKQFIPSSQMIQQLQFASPPHSAPGTLPFSLFLLEPAQSGHHKRYAAFPPTSFPPKMLHRGSVKPIVHSSIEDLVTQQLQRNEMDGILQDSCPAPSHLPKSVVDVLSCHLVCKSSCFSKPYLVE